MCSKAITSVFSGSSAKVETPKAAPATTSSAAVQAAEDAARQRAASAVNNNTNRKVTSDQLDPENVRRPELLGS